MSKLLNRSAWVVLASLAAAASCLAQDATPPAGAPTPEAVAADRHADDPTDVLGFKLDDIHGEPADLEQYRGRVVMFVNVASACGLTPQYEGLESLYRKYKDRGLVILGIPANNFGEQEPGTDAEILEFCTGKYDVTFPMFSKISVKGDDQHPLYAKLSSAMEEEGGEPSWNFTKYLVDRTGHVVKRFDPRVKPGDDELLEEVRALLDQPAPRDPTKPG